MIEKAITIIDETDDDRRRSERQKLNDEAEKLEHFTGVKQLIVTIPAFLIIYACYMLLFWIEKFIRYGVVLIGVIIEYLIRICYKKYLLIRHEKCVNGIQESIDHWDIAEKVLAFARQENVRVKAEENWKEIKLVSGDNQELPIECKVEKSTENVQPELYVRNLELVLKVSE